MLISDVFNLNKSQRELDFVNIDLNADLPLFLDPYLLSLQEDNWSRKSNNTLRLFFQLVVNLVKGGNIESAKALFQHLHEPSETHLGLSKGKPKGKGVGKLDTARMFKRIVKSKAIQTGLVQYLEDTTIFVDRIGKDKLSDMATNIIRKHLIEYTQNQCRLWDFPLTPNIPSGFFWDDVSDAWNNKYEDMLVINGKVILLVPKSVVSYNTPYTPQKFHQHFILNFLQQEHLRLNTSLVEVTRTKKGVLKKKVTKKRLKETEAPYDKDFIRKFTIHHPEIYEQFKVEIASQTNGLTLHELEHFNYKSFCDFLIKQLESIKKGKAHADTYHNFIVGAMHFLFYPNLINPIKEYKIHNGRKRIDIVFDNSANKGFFKELHTISKIPCSYIMIECKNYSDDPVNPEIDQLAGRFGVNKGKFGILLCREIIDQDLFDQRCVDTFKDDRGLIISLTDKDLIETLKSFSSTGDNNLDNLLSDKKRRIILS